MVLLALGLNTALPKSQSTEIELRDIPASSGMRYCFERHTVGRCVAPAMGKTPQECWWCCERCVCLIWSADNLHITSLSFLFDFVTIIDYYNVNYPPFIALQNESCISHGYSRKAAWPGTQRHSATLKHCYFIGWGLGESSREAHQNKNGCLWECQSVCDTSLSWDVSSLGC